MEQILFLFNILKTEIFIRKMTLIIQLSAENQSVLQQVPLQLSYDNDSVRAAINLMTFLTSIAQNYFRCMKFQETPTEQKKNEKKNKYN